MIRRSLCQRPVSHSAPSITTPSITLSSISTTTVFGFPNDIRFGFPNPLGDLIAPKARVGTSLLLLIRQLCSVVTPLDNHTAGSAAFVSTDPGYFQPCDFKLIETSLPF